jgi:type II secretory pathway pseudopilin PulG
VKFVIRKNAFTIVELIVAMGLLVMLVGLSSVVFSTTVKAHRKASATIEITRNLRVLTEQLNADFRGLRADAPLMMWFDSRVSGTTEERYDMIHFFADGDFQTMKQYGGGPKTVVGNIARIYYGHANSVEPPLLPNFTTSHVLSRKSHILTADAGILLFYGEIPLITNGGLLDYSQFAGTFGQTSFSGNYLDENELEFNTISLTQWVNAMNYLNAGNPDNANTFIARCMSDPARPYIDLEDFQTLHLLMAQGVMDFSVQWAYTVADLTTSPTAYVPLLPANANYFVGVRWWPSIDPDADGDDTDSDFSVMNGGNPFGAYFELPGQTSNLNWNRVKPNSSETVAQMEIRRCRTGDVFFRPEFYPKALKFTFRLKDSNNVFPNGKTFTHIVYLDN